MTKCIECERLLPDDGYMIINELKRVEGAQPHDYIDGPYCKRCAVRKARKANIGFLTQKD